MQMYRSRIAGTGSYLPKKILSNFDLEKLVDTNDQWIRERTGIEKRHIAEPGESTSDLALHASRKALEAANLRPEDLDLIIFATISGDAPMPATACYLQVKLGCKSIPAFDLAAACSGALYGMTIADQMIRTGMYKNILIVGAEVLHNMINYKDRETCILFGDAAGAIIVSRAEENDPNVIFNSHLRAEGSLSELLIVAAGGSRQPLTKENFETSQMYVTMKGREIFKNAVRTMSTCAKEVLQQSGYKIEDVSWLVPHQANSRIMEAVANQFDFPMDRVINIVNEMGNTSAATIPVAFDMAVRDGRIKRGQLVLLTAFGAGLTAGGMILRF